MEVSLSVWRLSPPTGCFRDLSGVVCPILSQRRHSIRASMNQVPRWVHAMGWLARRLTTFRLASGHPADLMDPNGRTETAALPDSNL